MADELCLDGTLAIETLLEGKDHQHAVHALPHPAQTAMFPGPELRADEPDHRHAGPAEVLGQAKVDVREIDEHGGIGTLLLDGAHQAAIARVDQRHVPKDLCDAHYGYIFGSDNAPLPRCFHGAPAQASERRSG